MTVVVTGNCLLCKFTECVTVCPVSCFHADDQMVYVDPLECIDCMACVVTCPVRAIHSEANVPAGEQHWIGLNRDRSRTLPVVSTKQTPLPTAQAKRARLGF